MCRFASFRYVFFVAFRSAPHRFMSGLFTWLCLCSVSRRFGSVRFDAVRFGLFGFTFVALRFASFFLSVPFRSVSARLPYAHVVCFSISFRFVSLRTSFGFIS